LNISVSIYWERCRVNPLTRFVSAMTGPNVPKDWWENADKEQPPAEKEAFLTRVKHAIAQYKASKLDNVYVDVHNYVFTPQGLSNIVTSLSGLEKIDFTVHRVYETVQNSNEFYLILRKNIRKG
jgi:hypothetical protein